MVVGDADGVRFVDLDTGKVHNAAGQQNSAVVRAAFSPMAGGVTAVATAIIVGHGVAEDLETLVGPAGQITALAFSPDGATLYSRRSTAARSSDLSGARRFGRFAFGTGNLMPGALGAEPDGAVLAAGNGDGTVTFIDARTLRPTDPAHHPTSSGERNGVRAGRSAARRRRPSGLRGPGRRSERAVVTRWRAQQEGFFFPA
jgi:hypothetical protein